MTTQYGAIDLLAEITGGGDFGKLAPAAVELTVYGLRCRCISLDALIQSKRAVGRPKDLQALAELELIRGVKASDDDSAKAPGAGEHRGPRTNG